MADLGDLVGRARQLGATLTAPQPQPQKLNELILQAAMLQQLGALIIDRANEIVGELLEGDA